MDGEFRRLYKEGTAVRISEVDCDVDRVIDCTFRIDIAIAVNINSTVIAGFAGEWIGTVAETAGNAR